MTKNQIPYLNIPTCKASKHHSAAERPAAVALTPTLARQVKPLKTRLNSTVPKILLARRALKKTTWKTQIKRPIRRRKDSRYRTTRKNSKPRRSS